MIVPAAVFFSGNGKDHPRLRNAGYDFPDAPIDIGALHWPKSMQPFLLLAEGGVELYAPFASNAPGTSWRSLAIIVIRA